MKQIITRINSLILLPEGEPIFHERGMVVSIEDDAAGEYIKVKSNTDEAGSIDIDPSAWPALRDAIDTMMDDIAEKARKEP